MSIALALVLPLIFSLLATPWIMRVAIRIGAIDKPNERKIHTSSTPRLGGLAICSSFFLMWALMVLIEPSVFASSWVCSIRGVVLLVSLLVIVLLGIWDDLRTLKPGLKFYIQVIVATACYAAGFRISNISAPFSSGVIEFGSLAYPITILWIVGVTNAFNLIDGLDGLASGVGIIASLTTFSLMMLNGDIVSALLVLVLAGAMMGFLRYNFMPAKIFLGDSGSLFIGFTLAVLSVQGSTKGSTAVAIIIPILVLGLPIVDTVLAMTRRLLGSFHPDQQKNGSLLNKLRSMFVPDRRHIHHQLLALGLSHRNAVLMLYVVSLFFGIVAFATTFTKTNGATLLLLGGVGIAVLEGVRRLRYREMSILSNGMLLPIYKSAIINKGIFLSILDLGFIAFAFSASFLLTLAQTSDGGHGAAFFLSLILVCGIQICVFYFMGLYRGTFHGLGIGDLLKIIRAVAISVIITAVTLVYSFKIYAFLVPPIFLLDFFILLSLIAGSRMSFRVLTYIFRKETRTGKRVLIYGSNLSGVVTLQHMLSDDRFNLQLVGFIVDNPDLEGKRVNGYKVFGGHWKLPGLLKKHQVDEVLISNDRIHSVVLERLKQAADAHGIALKRPKLLLENVTLRPYKHSRAPEAKNLEVQQQQKVPVVAEGRQTPPAERGVFSSRRNGD